MTRAAIEARLGEHFVEWSDDADQYVCPCGMRFDCMHRVVSHMARAVAEAIGVGE